MTPCCVDTVAALANNLESQRTAFLSVAVLALAVSALGILNIGLASMAERSRELVVRRAIGATRLNIVSQVVLTAILIGLVSAAVALGLVVLAVHVWVPG